MLRTSAFDLALLGCIRGLVVTKWFVSVCFSHVLDCSCRVISTYIRWPDHCEWPFSPYLEHFPAVGGFWRGQMSFQRLLLLKHQVRGLEWDIGFNIVIGWRCPRRNLDCGNLQQQRSGWAHCWPHRHEPSALDLPASGFGSQTQTIRHHRPPARGRS